MPKAVTTQQDTPPAPIAHRVTRGLREGEIRTRAAANGAPASASFDADALTFEFTLLTSRSCNGHRYILAEGDRYPMYTRVEEKLDMRGAVGLDELVGSSVLNSHWYWDIGSVVGVIEAAAVECEALNCRAAVRTGRAERWGINRLLALAAGLGMRAEVRMVPDDDAT